MKRRRRDLYRRVRRAQRELAHEHATAEAIRGGAQIPQRVLFRAMREMEHPIRLRPQYASPVGARRAVGASLRRGR